MATSLPATAGHGFLPAKNVVAKAEARTSHPYDRMFYAVCGAIPSVHLILTLTVIEQFQCLFVDQPVKCQIVNMLLLIPFSSDIYVEKLVSHGLFGDGQLYQLLN